ncbi:hypothetical protein Q5752_006066 [Cryptotrichosporon argae]
MFSTLASALPLLACLGSARAAPTPRAFQFPFDLSHTGCAVPGLSVPLPAGQGVLIQPAGQSVLLATVGTGTQNYTCDGSKYVSTGAVANLFDVACSFENVAPADRDSAAASIAELAKQTALFPSPSNPSDVIAVDHFFIDTPTSPSAGMGSISPLFASNTDGTDRVVLSKTGQLDSPADPAADVAWLELAALPGDDALAATVYRTHTVGGQPPSSCAGSGDLTVPYAAMYWFLK